MEAAGIEPAKRSLPIPCICGGFGEAEGLSRRNNPCESFPPGRRRAPNWKAQAPKVDAGKVFTDRRTTRATSKPLTRPISVEGAVKEERTTHGILA
jgi:hypothetical protein